MSAVPEFIPIELDPISFDGGFDDSTPPLRLQTGFCRAAQNFEIAVNGGYRRIDGYERHDGQTSPSSATYAILSATITDTYNIGDILTGASSGAHGVIAAATDDYFVLTKKTGTFTAETLNISGSPVATCTGDAVVDGAATPELHAQYRAAAADIYRADIDAVPGSGSVIGVWSLNGVTYAVRNNVGGTAAAIYKSTGSGWSAITLFYEVAFSSGSGTEPAEGATITQGANSATLKRVVIESGDFATSDAAGRLIVTQPAPGSFSAAAFTAGITANCDGAESAITLTIGGHYETKKHNFGPGMRTYGCSGTNRGFEFDGTVYVPINTGMDNDKPDHMEVHKEQLFFSFGRSVQHSGIGAPYEWSPILGASEIAMGDDVNAMAGQPGSETAGGAMTIFCRNKIGVLYGNSVADWNLVSFDDEDAGGYAYSVQSVNGLTYMLDDRGAGSLQTVQAFGNFQSATISERIQKLMKSKRLLVVGSSVSRDKNQYRLFFSDKSALFFTFAGRKLRGVMPMLFADTPTCIWSGEGSDGSEISFFGASNGYVYQLEKGTSFDGASIESFMELAYNSQKNVRQLKKYKRVMFEISGEGFAEYAFTYGLAYNSPLVAQPVSQTEQVSLSSVFWDSFVWDSFTWDGITLMPTSNKMSGSGENVSLILRSDNAYSSPLTISGAIIHFGRRRGLRK